MIHVVAPRSQNTLKIFTRDGSLWKQFVAGFDAWGNHGQEGALPLWGHNCWMPIGHYVLGAPQVFDKPIASEGYGQIPIQDIDSGALGELVKAGYATVDGLTATIGGIEAPLAQLAEYDRAALFVHGGGSNAPDPYADRQQLCRTEGCPRMENIDWREFAAWLTPLVAGNIIVFTALETPAELAC